MSHRTMKSLGAAILILSVVNLISGDGSTTTKPHNVLATTGTTTSPNALPIDKTTSKTTEKSTLPNTVTTTASHITTRETTGRITSNETETSTSIQSNTTTDNTTLSTTTNKLDIPYPTESSTSGKSELPAPTVSKSQPTETQSTHISTKPLPTKSHLQKDSPENTLLNAEAAPNNPEENDVKEQQPSYHKGILIGVGCVVALIVLVVLVFLYKICQKKPPEAQHSGTKVSAQEKESVTLLSVKTSATDSEAKRTALPHQTEYIIEC